MVGSLMSLSLCSVFFGIPFGILWPGIFDLGAYVYTMSGRSNHEGTNAVPGEPLCFTTQRARFSCRHLCFAYGAGRRRA